jgi:aminopeptidase YwaD
MIMIKYLKSFAFLLSFIMAAGISFSGYAQETVPGTNIIQAGNLLETVTYLSSPDLEGRAPGSTGYYTAVRYMSGKFVKLGLKPLPEGGFSQMLPVEYCHITENPELDLVENGTTIKSFKLGEDFVCRGQTGFGNVTGNLVFCGYGISEPSFGYDDYAGADVKGKIVLVFKQNPAWKIEGADLGKMMTRYKENKAAEHGAAALIFVSTPRMKDPQKPIGSIMDGDGNYDEDFPALQISISVADELLTGKPFDLKSLQQQIDTLKKPLVLDINKSLHISVKGEYFKDRQSMNVVAFLPGSDEKLSSEYLVIGAHLDHVGKQGKDLYFPGANDNASGSAAVAAIAEAFTKNGVKPKRSIIFVLYTSEEQGLFGSKYFVENCPVAKEKIVAAINLDCVGYGDSIQVGAGKSAPKLWSMAWKQDSVTSKLMSPATWEGGGADLEALYQAGIPGLYFVTRNSYAHLHLPSDKPATLNKDLYEKLVRLAYGVAYKVAMGEYQKEVLKK